MYFTNNIRTVYNLSLYSDGVYTGRNVEFLYHYPSWNFLCFYNRKPYGNIDKKIKVPGEKIEKFF